jgi:hypothetical protein
MTIKTGKIPILLLFFLHLNFIFLQRKVKVLTVREGECVETLGYKVSTFEGWLSLSLAERGERVFWFWPLFCVANINGD